MITTIFIWFRLLCPWQIAKNLIMILFCNFSWQGQTVVSTIVADELVSWSQCEAVGSSNATSSRRRIRRGKQQHTPKDPIHPKSTGLVEASQLFFIIMISWCDSEIENCFPCSLKTAAAESVITSTTTARVEDETTSPRPLFVRPEPQVRFDPRLHS